MATNPTSPGGVANGDYITETWGDRADAYLLHVGPNRPRCSAYRAAAKNVASATTYAIEFDSEDIDTDAFHSLVTNTTRLTIPASTGGVWSLHGGVTFTGTPPSSGGAFVGFRINGGAAVWRTSVGFTASLNIYASFSCLATLAAGDYVECITHQTSGAAQDLVGYLQIVQIGW